MKIVIEIPDEMYAEMMDENCIETMIIPYKDIIKNGTPLPKGHGDLIDRNDLLQESYCIDDWSGNEVNIVDTMTVEVADAIIEADTESKDADSD